MSMCGQMLTNQRARNVSMTNEKGVFILVRDDIHTWKTVLTSFIFNSWYQIKYLDRPRQSYCPQCTFSKIVNKGLLCKSADKYGMQKMGPGHRSSLNNRYCILCDLTTHLQRHEESILLRLSLSNSSHTPASRSLPHCSIV